QRLSRLAATMRPSRPSRWMSRMGSVDTRARSSPRPRNRSTRVALAARPTAAPASRSSADCSSTSAAMPRCRSRSASVSPPTPAPMITTGGFRYDIMPPLGRILTGTGFLGLTCRLPQTYREGMVEFGILGPLEIAAGGQPLPVQGARTRAVLAMLLVHANQVVPADRLTAELWAGQPADRAAASLQVRVSQLRKALRAAGEADRLVTRPPGYLIRVTPGALAARRLDEALGLWRGAALADVDDAPFAQAEARRLEERRLAALESRAEARLACGGHRELIGELETLTAAHPLRERLWAHRMLALYRAGRQAEALRAYRDLRAILTGELGIEPSP